MTEPIIAREGRCNHFNGIQNERCLAGVKYEVVRKPNDDGKGYSFPCLTEFNRSGALCDKLQWPTEQEIAATEAEDKRRHDLLARGLSGCCEAPIDTSQVIQSGRYKGHGPRFCSKCGKCVLIV